MTTDLADPFFDNVAFPCPRCEGLEVSVYSYTNDANVHIIEARCSDCNAKWSIG